jgi:hypothetical protein
VRLIFFSLLSALRSNFGCKLDSNPGQARAESPQRGEQYVPRRYPPKQFPK